MSALVEEATPAEVGPRRVPCPRCKEPVLRVPLRGGGAPVLVEARETDPLMRCPVCLSDRLRDPTVRCYKCKTYPRQRELRPSRAPGGRRRAAEERKMYAQAERIYLERGEPPKGWVGEVMRGMGIALGPDGYGRIFAAATGSTRGAGEAIHRAHRCGSVRLLR